MIANGILENPALFSGVSETPIECVQKWINICFNSTLTDEAYDVLNQTKTLYTIQERPLFLTFQCFHHHLVFMLEKILPKSKRRVFNTMKKFNEVLHFLNKELNIVPQLFDADEFRKHRPLYLDYINYSDLTSSKEESSAYVAEANSGKYFKSKVDETYENWTELFDEN